MGKFEKGRVNREEAELEKAFRDMTKQPKNKKAASGKSKNKPNSKKVILLVCSLVLVLLAAVVGISIAASMPPADDGLILPNAYAAGINLGGMTPEEAKNALSLATHDTYSAQDMVITLPEEELRLTPGDTGIQLDVDAAVEALYQYGRTGTAKEQKAAREAAKTTDYVLDLIPYLSLNTGYIQEVMDQLEEKYNTALLQPSAAVSCDQPSLKAEDISEDVEHQVLTVTLGVPESALDIDALYGNILDAYNINTFAVSMEFTVLQPDQPDLEALYEQYCVEPVDASFDPETYDVIPETYGYSFDLEALKLLVSQAQPGEAVEIKLDYVVPTVLAKDLEGTLYQDLLGKCEAYQYSSPNRIANLNQACKTLNGMIILPGATFSYNKALGERTEERGYKMAGTYVDGVSVNTVGGGICQVSSVLYNCVMQADFEIVERYNHMFNTGYLPLGTDATVSWGTLDFKFKNTSNYPVRIEAVSDNGRVSIKLYGTDEKDYYVVVKNEILKTHTPSTVYKTMEKNNPDGHEDGDVIQTSYTGYDVKTYRYKYDKVTDELVEVVYEDFSDYNKRDKIICKIESDEPTVPETTVPEETTPEVTQPEVTEPEVTEPQVTEPEVTEPQITEPETTVPDSTTEGDFDAGTPGIGGVVDGEGEG